VGEAEAEVLVLLWESESEQEVEVVGNYPSGWNCPFRRPLDAPTWKPDQSVPGLWAAAISSARICWLTAAVIITALEIRSLFT
jgi:hypothetical protein